MQNQCDFDFSKFNLKKSDKVPLIKFCPTLYDMSRWWASSMLCHILAWFPVSPEHADCLACCISGSHQLGGGSFHHHPHMHGPHSREHHIHPSLNVESSFVLMLYIAWIYWRSLSLQFFRWAPYWHISLGFASVKHCIFLNSQFFETLGFLKLAIFRTNSCLPWKKFIRNLPLVSRTRTKALLSSFHLNGHTLGFHSQTQKLDPPSVTQKTVPEKVLLNAFNLNGHYLGLAFLWCCLSCVQSGSNFLVE